MVWRRWAQPSKSEWRGIMRGLRREKTARFYADEDIEEWVVALIRAQGLNITSARELGFRGKPDSFHAAYAFRHKRFLISRNGRDYLNDRKFPFHRIHGIVIIAADPKDNDAYTSAIAQLVEIEPYGDTYQGMKIELSSEQMKTRMIDYSGRLVTARLMWKSGVLYEWTEI